MPMDWQPIASSITLALDEPFEVEHCHSIGGGCINSAFRLEGKGRQFFIKLNQIDLLDMFIAEAEGLTELTKAHAIKVPEPVCYGTSNGQAFLVLENLNFRGSIQDTMRRLGQQLAALHRYTAKQFGWQRDNTIGSTLQPNDWQQDWGTFWRDARLGHQLRLAKQQGASKRMLNKGEKLMGHVAYFFRDYQPEASLLHGDLWSGNYSILSSGEPVIFDPAVYYGDRETDIAMTELFGGFSKDFYAAYNEAWPLDDGYMQRKTFYNLYHILNHYNIFGGSYGSQAEGMMDCLLSNIQ